MLDTITLHIAGKNNAEFELNEARFKKVSNENNETYVFNNVFYSNDKAKKQPIFINNNVKQNYTLIQFSVPKLLYGNSLKNVKIEDTQKLESTLQNRLNGIFETDFLNSNISRLDVTQNIEVQNEIPIYILALKEAYEQNGRYRVEQFKTETLRIKNNSRVFMLYDKVSEAVANKDITRQEAKAYGNILRYEIQHTKAKHVKTSFHKNFTLTEVLNESFFETAKQFQLQTFENLFRNAGNYEMFMQDVTIMELVANYNKRNLLKNFLIKSMTDKFDIQHDYQKYENLLKLQGMKTSGIKKTIKELKTILKLGKTTQSDILTEIKMRLAG